MDILMQIEDWDGIVPPPAILKPRPLWAGKQVFTKILPRVNYVGSAAGKLDHEDAEHKGLSPTDCQVRAPHYSEHFTGPAIIA